MLPWLYRFKEKSLLLKQRFHFQENKERAGHAQRFFRNELVKISGEIGKLSEFPLAKLAGKPYFAHPK